MAITHSTVATSDDEDGAEVNKTEWNDDHVIDDGTLSIAKTTGLQAAIDGKQATITDGDLTIARTTGLQAAIDAKATVTALNTRPEALIVAASDNETDLATGTVFTFYMPWHILPIINFA